MANYEKTTKELIIDWAREHLRGAEEFNSRPVVKWFALNYPRTSPKTVRMHLRGMSTNNPAHRKNHLHIRADSDWDHFYRLERDTYRRFDPRNDPPPRYG